MIKFEVNFYKFELNEMVYFLVLFVNMGGQKIVIFVDIGVFMDCYR